MVFMIKHNWPQRDSIPGPRALQSGMLPLDHCDHIFEVSALKLLTGRRLFMGSLLITDLDTSFILLFTAPSSS